MSPPRHGCRARPPAAENCFPGKALALCLGGGIAGPLLIGCETHGRAEATHRCDRHQAQPPQLAQASPQCRHISADARGINAKVATSLAAERAHVDSAS